MLSAGHPDHPVKVMIMEIGFSSETRYAESVQEKMTQHGKLQHALLSIGFEMSILPMMLGTSGGGFNSKLDSVRAIGIPHERALHLIDRLSEHVDCVQTILDMRRLMQRHLPP